MKKDRKWNALAILNVLMSADGYLTTNQICSRADCDRKAVYGAMDQLEVNGFAIDIKSGDGYSHGANSYKYIGLRGF